MEYLAPFAVQSALMPANLTTLAHFSISSAMSFPKSAGESATTAPPRSASRALIGGRGDRDRAGEHDLGRGNGEMQIGSDTDPHFRGAVDVARQRCRAGNRQESLGVREAAWLGVVDRKHLRGVIAVSE
jgi:hypothetical protein